MNVLGSLLTTACLLLATAPGAGATQAADAPAKAPAAHPVLPGAEPLSGESLYQLQIALEDQDGAKFGLDHFRGQPVLIALFYASCPSACPLLIKDIQRVEAALGPEQLANLRVLLVSIDPENDTPAALKSTAKRYGIDEARWRLTRAKDTDVRTLAAVLGVKYNRDSSGAIGHTSRLTLLGPEGLPLTFIDGLGQPADKVLAALKAQQGPSEGEDDPR